MSEKIRGIFNAEDFALLKEVLNGRYDKDKGLCFRD